jgi:hypothetical protein
VIAGDYFDEIHVAHAFVRTLDGKITKLDAPSAGAAGAAFKAPTSIQLTYGDF